MNWKTKVVSIMLLALPLGIAVMATTSAGKSATAVYKSKCQMCHGPDGKAATKAGKMMKVPDLTIASNWKHGTSQAAAEKIVTEGAGKMPKYEKKLSPEEISAVALHMLEICGVAGH